MKPRTNRPTERIRVIFDTDTNNELDDQHALAYLLFNGHVFDLEGVTVNATYNGGGIDEHYREAERILELCTVHPGIPLLKGATASFEEIREHIDVPHFDGSDAVDFIIERAVEPSDRRLVLLAVGKLTNIALAYAKNPAIAANCRLVWLGSNYPDPGEYNQDNDEEAMNFLLDSDLSFEMVVVRYGKPSGTDAVRASLADIRTRMPGIGPRTKEPVMGRHGVAFSTFGDYSVNLFEHADYHGGPLTRALYDMAAVAIVKNPDWAASRRIPAPVLRDGAWVERSDDAGAITVWEDFDSEAIMRDFFRTMEGYVLVAGS